VATYPAFKNIVAEGESTINTWVLPEGTQLAYDALYYWKVEVYAASGAPAGDAVISSFRTMPEPAKPQPRGTQVTVPPAPPAPQITLTVPQAQTPPYVWIIIGIGALVDRADHTHRPDEKGSTRS